MLLIFFEFYGGYFVIKKFFHIYKFPIWFNYFFSDFILKLLKSANWSENIQWYWPPPCTFIIQQTFVLDSNRIIYLLNVLVNQTEGIYARNISCLLKMNGIYMVFFVAICMWLILKLHFIHVWCMVLLSSFEHLQCECFFLRGKHIMPRNVYKSNCKMICLWFPAMRLHFVNIVEKIVAYGPRDTYTNITLRKSLISKLFIQPNRSWWFSVKLIYHG